MNDKPMTIDQATIRANAVKAGRAENQKMLVTLQANEKANLEAVEAAKATLEESAANREAAGDRVALADAESRQADEEFSVVRSRRGHVAKLRKNITKPGWDRKEKRETAETEFEQKLTGVMTQALRDFGADRLIPDLAEVIGRVVVFANKQVLDEVADLSEAATSSYQAAEKLANEKTGELALASVEYNTSEELVVKHREAVKKATDQLTATRGSLESIGTQVEVATKVIDDLEKSIEEARSKAQAAARKESERQAAEVERARASKPQAPPAA